MAKKLTAKQEVFRNGIMRGLSNVEAARQAGYAAPSVAAFQLMRTPHMQESIQGARQARINGDLGRAALSTMEDLLSSEAPANVRYSAAKWILEAGGHGAGAAQGEDIGAKPLDQLDAGELEDVLRTGMQALADLSQQMKGHHVIEGEVRHLRDVDPAEDLDFLG